MIPESGVPLIGVRSWRVEPGGMLRSITRTSVWPVDAAAKAACTWPSEAERLGAPVEVSYTAHVESAPAPGCACGLYHRAWPVAGDGSDRPLAEIPGPVVGFSALWGKVIMDEDTGIRRGELSVPLGLCTRYCYDGLLAPVEGFPAGVCSLEDVLAAARRYQVPVSADLDTLYGMARAEMVRRMLARG